MKTKNKTRLIVNIGMLSALAVVFSFIEIPFPPAPYLKFEVSEVPVLVAGSALGVIPMIIVIVARGLVKLLSGWNTTTNVYALPELTSTIASLAIGFGYLLAKRLVKDNLFKRDKKIDYILKETITVSKDSVDTATEKVQKVVFINQKWQDVLIKYSFYLLIISLTIIGLLTCSSIISEVFYQRTFSWTTQIKIAHLTLSHLFIIFFITSIISGAIYFVLKNILDVAHFIRSLIVIASLTLVMVITNYLFITPSFTAGKYTWVTTFINGGGSSRIDSSNYWVYFIAVLGLYIPFNLIKGGFIMAIYYYIKKIEHRIKVD